MPRIKLNSLLDDAKQALEPTPAPATAVAADAAVQGSPRQRNEEQQAAAAESSVEIPAEVAPDAVIPLPAAAEVAAPERATAATGADKPPRRSSPRRENEKAQLSRVHYATLVRKEARLRDDQIESLTLRARRLSRNKAVTDQRITDNTLIRIAVDLLLAKENELAGTSEAELRKSVGL